MTAKVSPPMTFWDFMGAQQFHDSMNDLFLTLNSMPAVQNANAAIVSPTLNTMGLLPGSSATAPSRASSASPPAGGAAAGSSSSASPSVAAMFPEIRTANAAPEQGAPRMLPLEQALQSGGGAPPPPQATDLAKKIAKANEPANVELKIKAIRYLSKQNCVCYPEIMDSLLAALADCSERVRYEALQAIRRGCKACDCDPNGPAFNTGMIAGSRPSCQCQVKVISTLSDHLLERDIQGRLKERSVRIRKLAEIMIRECLETTPVESNSQPLPTTREPQPDPFPNQPLQNVPSPQ